MSRKSQIIGQTFVYIMGTVIFITIILYGYTKISDLLGREQTLCIERMGADMRAKVEQIGQTFDTINYALHTCGEYNVVCFLDSSYIARTGSSCSGAASIASFETFFTSSTAPYYLDSASKPPASIREQIRRCDEANMYVYQKEEVQFKPYNIGKINVARATAPLSSPSPLGVADASLLPNFNCYYATRGVIYLQFEGNGNSVTIRANPLKYERPSFGP